ncbi:hypothetical protein ACLOJK_011568 [Asimina triloba]
MTPIAVSFFHLFLFLSMAQAQDFETRPRSHGLGEETPLAFSPSAFEFFHPDSPLPTTTDSPLPLSMSAFSSTSAEPVAKAAQVHETNTRAASKAGGGAGGGPGAVAGIVLGCVLAVLLAMGAYHVSVKRRANISRAKAAGQPHV